METSQYRDRGRRLEVAKGATVNARRYPIPRELEVSVLYRCVVGGAADPPERIARLSRATPAELVERNGLSRAQAVRLACAFELVRRAAATPVRAPILSSAESVHDVVASELVGLERERFLVLLLDGKHRLQRIERVSEGTLTTSLVHPREVFRSAIREAAAAVIAVHNHPSGDPEPSTEDLEVTRRLRRAGRLLGIPLLDHVVVGAGGFVSLRERLW